MIQKTRFFHYIPNTAETSFFGMIETVEEFLKHKKTKAILSAKEILCRKVD